jgi:hypothetical protein
MKESIQQTRKILTIEEKHISSVCPRTIIFISGVGSVRDSDTSPAASPVIIILTFSWCALFSQTLR